MRRHPECRTNRQLEVLTVFLAHAQRKGGRHTYPTLGDIGRQMDPPITTRVGVLPHIDALVRRGDLERRYLESYRWRQWELTAQGRRRAKMRAEVMARRQKRGNSTRRRLIDRDGSTPT
jgi:hypothetical protein